MRGALFPENLRYPVNIHVVHLNNKHDENFA